MTGALCDVAPTLSAYLNIIGDQIQPLMALALGADSFFAHRTVVIVVIAVVIVLPLCMLPSIEYVAMCVWVCFETWMPVQDPVCVSSPLAYSPAVDRYLSFTSMLAVASILYAPPVLSLRSPSRLHPHTSTRLQHPPPGTWRLW